jgi:uncharacterized repeat protein (TIGR02543 family)
MDQKTKRGRGLADMLSTRVYIIVLGAWFAGSTLATATDFITVGKDRVHPTRILAKYKDKENVALQARAATLRDAGLVETHRYSLAAGLVLLDEAKGVALAQVNTPELKRQRLLDRIAAMRNSGLFDYVEADYVVSASLTPTDRAFVDGTLWGLLNYGQNGGVAGADIGVTNAWDITTGSTNVIVAIIDTGIRYTHKDLAAQMWHNPGEIPGNGADDDGNGYIDDVFGINAITGSGDPFDDNSHGTHVSGTIGAAANDGNPHVGVAWKVQLMACKFLDANGMGFTGDAITCIDYAVAKRARVLNASWGGGPFSQALFDSIAAARANRVLFVAAAGNDGSDNDLTPSYPASYQLDNIIAVAALDRADHLAFFSNYGRNSVHLGAPGVDIFSSTAGSDTEYSVYSGTSMATPHVSGVAALILANSTNATIAELRARLFTTVPVADLRGKSLTGGRVNAYRALSANPDGILEIYVDPPDGSDILAGSSTPVFVTVNDLYGVTNATVTGTYPGGTNLTFLNDGRPPDRVANDNIYSALLPVPTNTGPMALQLAVSAPGKTAANLTVTYEVMLRPANDDFVNAAKIPADGAFGDNIILATNKFATIEPKEPIHAGVPSVSASLWWNWTPTFTSDVLVDTTGSTFDTVVAVYTGNSLSSLKEVAATNDVNGRLQGYLHFTATNEITYRIVVAGHDPNQIGMVRLRVEPGGQADTVAPVVLVTYPPSGLMLTNAAEQRIVVKGTAYDPMPFGSGVKEVLVGASGGIASPAFGTTNWASTNQLQYGVNTISVKASDFAGNVSETKKVHVIFRPPDPINDLFLAGLTLKGTSGTVVATNINATKEVGEPLHAGNAGGKSVWWFFPAPSDGVLFLSTTNSTFDTLLAVYTGNRVNDLTPIASNDDAYDDGVTYSKIMQAVQGEQVYRIAVDGYAGSSGTVSLQYQFTPTNIFFLSVNGPNGRVSPASGYYAADSTVTLYAIPNPDYDFVGWTGEVTSSRNPLPIVMTGDQTLTAQFAPHAYADDFETGGFTKLPWTTSGDAPWIVQSNVVAKGKFAARSGVITNFQESVLTLNVVTPAGVGSFDYKVSSEPFWDRLEFFLNGVSQQIWSGEIDWNEYGFVLPAGTNTLEWRYSKDAFISQGLDAAFIDNLQLPPGKSGGGAGVTVLSADLQNASFTIQLQGLPDQEYVIEASSDLTNWKSIHTGVAVKGVLVVADPDAGGAKMRFYRAVIR